MRAEHHCAYHSANQYISALPFPPTNASSAAYRVKEQSVLGTNTPFYQQSVCVLRICVCVCFEC